LRCAIQSYFLRMRPYCTSQPDAVSSLALLSIEGGHEEATGLTLVGGAAIRSRSKAGVGFGDLLYIYCHSVRGRQQNIRDFDADFAIVPDCAGM
jgi:hypothetical protein